MTCVVFVMWWLVTLPTVRGFLRGTLFEYSCVTSLPEDYRRAVLEKQLDNEANKSHEPQDKVYLATRE